MCMQVFVTAVSVGNIPKLETTQMHINRMNESNVAHSPWKLLRMHMNHSCVQQYGGVLQTKGWAREKVGTLYDCDYRRCKSWVVVPLQG